MAGDGNDPGDRLSKSDDPRRRGREIVDRVLTDGFMIFLALLMIPIIAIPLAYPQLDEQYAEFLSFADLTIIGIFVMEYVLKLAFAADRWKHFINGWHLLDLVIITLPFLEIMPFIDPVLSRRTPILRLLRIARVAAVGGRSVKRRIGGPTVESRVERPAPEMRIQALVGDLSTVKRDITLDEMKRLWESPTESWLDLSGVAETDLGSLSRTVGLPEIFITSKLVDESYPRIDYIERHSVIFLQTGRAEMHEHGTHHLTINRTGFLIICSGRNILTVSKTQAELFDKILDRARQRAQPGQPLLVTILYTILEHILYRYKQIIGKIESELLRLENIPRGEAPRDFLETAFQLKKEVNRLVSSLLHMKEVLTVITSRRVPLEGFDRSHEELFDILLDETVYLHETAQNAKDDLASQIELHINTTTYEMNKVMRVLAVITCLALIPAFISGMFGENLADAPWGFHLWQVVGLTTAAMLGLGYMFYKLGWLKS
jgi:Mg2+ and Co2+ transporter CorA